MSRQPPGRRADYRWFHAITTRWMDNDVFRNDDDTAAAQGYFVHVFVDRATQRPAPVPDAAKAALEQIAT